MGVGGISIWQLLILLVIILLLFGTKRLRNLGSDLGSAVKGFKSAMSSEANKEEDPAKLGDGKQTTVDGQATREKDRT